MGKSIQYQRKEIPGYDGKYLIDTDGNVFIADRSVRRRLNDGRVIEYTLHGGDISLMNSHDNGNGYKYITLRKDCKRKNHYIHRLVAEAFIPNPEGLPEINHIDYDKKNNNVENLEWVSRKNNVGWSCDRMRHMKKGAGLTNIGMRYISMRNGRYRLSIRISRLGYQIDKCFKTLEEAISAREAFMSGKKYFEQ